MLVSTADLLHLAVQDEFALGAFNIYNMEGALAVAKAAEATRSPAILQLHPAALKQSAGVLAALCKAAAANVNAPISLHLDHATSDTEITFALEQGFSSVMFDGSSLSFEENLQRTKAMALLAHQHGAVIEAELGRLTGSEDGLSVPEYEQKLTDPDQAAHFVEATKVDALAVCIGNVHGRTRVEPTLDFERLAQIRRQVNVPLVLHGASGLSPDVISEAIRLGTRKFNVNTEVREAYLQALRQRFDSSTIASPEIIDLIGDSIAAMRTVIVSKLELFGSAGRVESLPI